MNLLSAGHGEFPTPADAITGQPAPAETPASSRDLIALALLACVVSVSAFFYFFRQGEILMYGDAIAHLNIARRILDSRTPGLLQIGTVWLPLPHLLAAPFVAFMWGWQTGIGGSIPPMAAYVLASLGIFILVSEGLAHAGASASSVRLSAWVAALIFLANPNLIYLQTTPMTESLSLAAFVWATLYFGRFIRSLIRNLDGKAQAAPEGFATQARALRRCAACLAAATMIRYDGWFAAAVFALTAAILLIFNGKLVSINPELKRHHRRLLMNFVLWVGAAPMLWLVYNTFAYSNPLEFAVGQYSAIGIEQRTRRGDLHHPGWHNPFLAALYFVKSAKLNLGQWHPSGYTFFPLALIGALVTCFFAGPIRYWLLLWSPVAFYALAMAWGGVPIFIPAWWPFSHYNVRYGVQLLPAISVFTAVFLYFASRMLRGGPMRVVPPALVLSMVAVCYVYAWVGTPISLREPRRNSIARIVLERALAHQLRRLPPESSLLMYVGDHGRSLQIAGIPLRRALNENNRREWKLALSAPSRWADYVIVGASDPLHGVIASDPGASRLQPVSRIVTPGQGTVTIFRSLRP